MATADLLGPQQEQVNLQADFDKAGPNPPVLDAVALKEKYIAERDKRLQHGGGIDQYRLIDERGQFSDYLKDPWSKPFDREPITEEVNDVVIIGGGYGAQYVKCTVGRESHAVSSMTNLLTYYFQAGCRPFD